MTSYRGLLDLGDKRITKGITTRCNINTMEQIFKNFRCSDYFLKLGNMKMESLVIVNQNVTVNVGFTLYTPHVTVRKLICLKCK